MQIVIIKNNIRKIILDEGLCALIKRNNVSITMCDKSKIENFIHRFKITYSY